jgi:hypothetical protein
MKVFFEQRPALIYNFVSAGSVSIIVNDDIDKYLHNMKGLRQGDPLSTIIFNIVVDIPKIVAKE